MSAPSISAKEFEEKVLQSKEPVLVDFWATWCPPCRQMAPIVDQLAAELEGKLKVVSVDVDQNPLLQAQYGISAIPTFNIYKGGEVVKQLIGGHPKAAFRKEIESVL